MEVAFGRFLGNERVNVKTISQEFSKKTNEASRGKKHVLCIQDTVQLTYPTQPIKKIEFGPTGDADTKGLFIHPGVIVDVLIKISLDLVVLRPGLEAMKNLLTRKETVQLKKKNLFAG